MVYLADKHGDALDSIKASFSGPDKMTRELEQMDGLKLRLGIAEYATIYSAERPEAVKSSLHATA
jgi:hypothetical protein